MRRRASYSARRFPRVPQVTANADPVAATPAAIFGGNLLAAYIAEPDYITLNGAAVSGWDDSTVNALNLTQGSAASQATWVASSTDGRGAVDFGGSHFLEIVAGLNTAGATSRTGVIVVATDQGANGMRYLWHYLSGGTGLGSMFRDAADWGCAQNCTDGLESSSHLAANASIHMAAITPLASGHYYVNNSTTYARAKTSALAGDPTRITMGSLADGSSGWDGLVHEMILLKTAPSLADISTYYTTRAKILWPSLP